MTLSQFEGVILHHLKRYTMLHNKVKQDDKKSVKLPKDFPKDLSNDPTLNKRADESQAFLKKHGFPEELKPRK